jgi:predicted DCC family thiol-disulfide oxidoreductase YuxK
MSAQTSTEGRLVFDGECGFCTRCVHWLSRLDRRHRVETVPYQAPGVPASIGATTDECADAVQWLGPDGRRRSGAAAVNGVLDVLTRTPAPSALYRLTSWPQERLYRWVADHRSRFPGTTPHCAARPDACR